MNIPQDEDMGEEYREKARSQYADINIDDGAAVLLADTGAWVAAWVWVSGSDGDGEDESE